MNLIGRLIAPLAEAWQELRVHRLRVLLSLIVVMISVAAFATVLALGQMLEKSLAEQSERYQGRPALITISDPGSTTKTSLADAFDAIVTRFGIDYSSRLQYLSGSEPGGFGATILAVDADYATMHRVTISEGRWLSDADAYGGTASVVIDDSWWRSIGSPDLGTRPTVIVTLQTSFDPNTGEVQSAPPREAVVVGVSPLPPGVDPEGTSRTGFILFDQRTALGAPREASPEFGGTQYELWVPPEDGKQAEDDINIALSAQLGLEPGSSLAFRTDYLANGILSGFDIVLVVFGGISILVMGLGGLSLLNITLVTVRHRIREIGVRRSFGATAPRVFFGVLLESVVATLVAGVAGIGLAISILRLPLVTDQLFSGMQNPPGFPLQAALTSLLAAGILGALAGLVPALVAVRVKPIDAIRI